MGMACVWVQKVVDSLSSHEQQQAYAFKSAMQLGHVHKSSDPCFRVDVWKCRRVTRSPCGPFPAPLKKTHSEAIMAFLGQDASDEWNPQSDPANFKLICACDNPFRLQARERNCLLM